MLKKFYIIVIFMSFTNFSFAITGQVTHDTLKTKFKKFYIIEFGDKPPIATKYAFIDPMVVGRLSSLSNSSDAEISKKLKVDFVIIVTLIPNTKLLTFNEILDLYKIQTKDRKLPVLLDDEIIDYPETILVSQNQIEKIEVIKGTNSSHIRITLIGYEEIKKELKKNSQPNW